MANLNIAGIKGRAKEALGYDISEQEAQNVMNVTKGGDPGEVMSYFQRYSGKGISSPTSVYTPTSAPIPTTQAVPTTEQMVETARKMAEAMFTTGEQFRQPAIASLEAGRPGIEARFTEQQRAIEAEKAPTEQRYQALLDEVTRRGGEAEQRQQLATSREYSRRGIPLSSGVYEQGLAEALRPITAEYAGMTKDIGYERESALRNLQNLLGQVPIQQTEAETALNQAIAAIQASAAPEAIQAAQGLYGAQMGAQEAAYGRELQQWQTGQQNLQAELARELQKWQTEQQVSQQSAQLAQQQQQFEAEQAAQAAQLAWQQPWQEQLWQYEIGKPYYKPTTGTTDVWE